MQDKRFISQIPDTFKFYPGGNDNGPVIANLSNKILLLMEPSIKEAADAITEIFFGRLRRRFLSSKSSGRLFDLQKNGQFRYIKLSLFDVLKVNPRDVLKIDSFRNKAFCFLDQIPNHELPNYFRFPLLPDRQIYDALIACKNYEQIIDMLSSSLRKARNTPESLRNGLLDDIHMEFYARSWILFPQSLITERGMCKTLSSTTVMRAAAERTGVDKAFLDAMSTYRMSRTVRLLLLCTTFKHARDLSQNMIDALLSVEPKKHYQYDRVVLNRLIYAYIKKIQYSRNGTPLIIRADEPEVRIKREKESSMQKGSGTFLWALQSNAIMDNWVNILRTYVQQQKRSVGLAGLCADLNNWPEFLLDYGRANGDDALRRIARPENIVRSELISPNPLTHRDGGPYYLEFLKKKYIKSVRTWEESCNKAIRITHNVFCWYASETGHHEIATLINPYQDLYPDRGKPSQTTRNSLPPKIVNKAREILTRNDYEWAKTIATDYFEFERKGNWIWSPCRALAMETLLTLPIRKDNLQSADTGQEDDFVYDIITGNFIKNAHKKIAVKRQLGILREYRDSSGRIVGFYFTNDKIHKDGLDVKWDNPKLRKKIIELIEFNHRYAGPAQLIHRTQIKQVTPATVDRFPFFYPVFRDIANIQLRARSLPLSAQRLSKFLLLLLDETEKELNADLCPEETPLQLITERYSDEHRPKHKPGSPKNAIVDLHSLRVTGITLFALAGLPVTIIAEFLAGHMSLLMDLYYQKIGVSVISAAIDKAFNNIQTSPDLQLLDFIKTDQSIAQALLGAAVTADALKSLSNTQRGFWTVSRGFICPNGGSLCNEGNLEPIKVAGHLNRHTIVEGGKGNCPLCRFSIAGPMTLPEQILSLQSYVGILFDHNQKRANVRRDLETAYTLKDRQKARSLEADIEVLDRESETLTKTFAYRVHWIQSSIEASPFYEIVKQQVENGASCEEIRNKTMDEKGRLKGNALLTMGSADDLKMNIRHATDEELIITLATFGQFKQIDRLPSMDLRLVKLMDKMLLREGRDPFLFSLDADTAAAAAVQMSYFLSSYYNIITKRSTESGGRDITAELLRGNRSLAQDDPSGKLLSAIQKYAGRIQSGERPNLLSLDDVFRDAIAASKPKELS